jgi:hypothetical protein
LKFYYAHVLRKPWVAPGLIKPPKSQRLPDIVTISQAKRIFAATAWSVTGCFSSRSIAWDYVLAKDCDFTERKGTHTEWHLLKPQGSVFGLNYGI